MSLFALSQSETPVPGGITIADQLCRKAAGFLRLLPELWPDATLDLMWCERLLLGADNSALTAAQGAAGTTQQQQVNYQSFTTALELLAFLTAYLVSSLYALTIN